MTKIDTAIRLLYYMFINKGKMSTRDLEALDLRANILPITINDAQQTIESICKQISGITVNTITTQDFTHFYAPPNTFIVNTQRSFKPLRPTYKMTGSFRRAK